MLNKIKNNIFLKSTLILLIGGLLTKSLGFILKIYITRSLSSSGIGIYSLLGPTSALLTTLAIFSYPSTISKIVSENYTSNRNLFASIIPISIIINTIFIIILIILAPFISNTLLKTQALYLPIICLSISMPSITLSSIMKGYFLGKQRMFPYMLSNFIEQIIRFMLIILFINKFNNVIYKICFIILINILGEFFSQIVMLLYFPKLNIKKIKFNKSDIKLIMKDAIPSTMSKLVSSLTYFLEPIIITNILLYVGYSNSYIIYEYGVINSYSLSILLMPQFFIQNMSTSLIPELSKYYSKKDYKTCIKRIKNILIISVLMGIISTIFINIFDSKLLNLLYKTNDGINYIKILSPFIILFYIEYPLSNALISLNKSNEIIKITLITSIIRLLSLIIFSFLKIGIYSLIITIIINLIISTYLYYKEVRTSLVL